MSEHGYCSACYRSFAPAAEHLHACPGATVTLAGNHGVTAATPRIEGPSADELRRMLDLAALHLSQLGEGHTVYAPHRDAELREHLDAAKALRALSTHLSGLLEDRERLTWLSTDERIDRFTWAGDCRIDEYLGEGNWRTSPTLREAIDASRSVSLGSDRDG